MTNEENVAVASGPPPGDLYGDNQTFSFTECLPMETGTFTIFDSSGDGIYNGHYIVEFGPFIHEGDGNFGFEDTVELLIPNPCTEDTDCNDSKQCKFTFLVECVYWNIPPLLSHVIHRTIYHSIFNRHRRFMR